MKFAYRLNINDLKEANQVYAKRILKLYLIFAGFLILISLLPLLLQERVSFQEILFAILPYLLMVVVVHFGGNFIQNFVLKRNWNSQPNLKNEIRVETSDEELKITTPLAESKMQWSFYTHWRETPNSFMIYQSHACLNLFPKRAFVSNEQANEFRELLRAKLRNK